MGECFGERVTALVSLRRWRRVNVDIVAHEELFQHLAGSDEEITIAALTPELERVIDRRLRARCAVGR